MALKTQGTKLYIVDPADTEGPSVLAVACVTSINGVEVPRGQLDSTCLESEAKTFEPGMPTPGQMTFGLNFDPGVASHKKVYDLWRAGTKIEMAIGWSDGTADPDGVDSDSLFELPTTRSWLVMHDAYFANVPLNFALDALVQGTVSVQLSGFPDLIPKA